jgi:hypothetical protein
MRVEKVTCDGCGHDLTTRTNSVDYRLVLASESKPGYGPGVYTDMGIYPAVERAHHFCDLACLDRWRGRANHKMALWKACYAKWQEEHGTRHEGLNGASYWAYPGMPEETRKANDAEFEAAALEAFPMARPA